MSNIDALIAQADSAALNELADLYIADTTSAEDRRAVRAAVAGAAIQQAYEDLYFDGVGMDEPELFVRRTLAALYMTGGYGNPATAR